MDENKIIQMYRDGESLKIIADKFSTYKNKIRRILIKHNEPLRDKSEAQKIALETGRTKHPTKGTKRDAETKLKIGMTVAETYQDKSDDEKKAAADRAKQMWEAKTDKEKAEALKKMTTGRLESASIGSKLERDLVALLKKDGIEVNFHTKVFGGVEVDLFLPEFSFAVEIDGVSHYNNIWGDDKLKKTQRADNKKDAFIIEHGATILRVKNTKSHYAYKDAVMLKEHIVKVLKKKREPKLIRVDIERL